MLNSGLHVHYDYYGSMFVLITKIYALFTFIIMKDNAKLQVNISSNVKGFLIFQLGYISIDEYCH